MIEFRCYFLNDRDRIAAVEMIDAVTVAAAIENADAKLRDRPGFWSVELWQRDRMVYRPKKFRATPV